MTKDQGFSVDRSRSRDASPEGFPFWYTQTSTLKDEKQEGTKPPPSYVLYSDRTFSRSISRTLCRSRGLRHPFLLNLVSSWNERPRRTL